MDKKTFEIPEDVLSLIMEILGQLPYNQVSNVIQRINTVIIPQMVSKTEENKDG